MGVGSDVRSGFMVPISLASMWIGTRDVVLQPFSFVAIRISGTAVVWRRGAI